MGNLLGASSPATNPQRLNEPSPLDISTWVEVRSVDRLAPDPAAIVAFAVDLPQPGDRLRGAGFEISGWVIGRDGPVSGVRVVSGDTTGDIQPLELRRPDVASDYAAIPHAGSSGFAVWAPVALRQNDPVTLEAQ